MSIFNKAKEEFLVGVERFGFGEEDWYICKAGLMNESFLNNNSNRIINMFFIRKDCISNILQVTDCISMGIVSMYNNRSCN